MRLWRSLSRCEKTLIVLFLLTLPFLRPRVRDDGIGYYAYLRSPLVNHNLSFAGDWDAPPQKIFYDCRTCASDAKKYWNNPANQLLFVYLNEHVYVNPITKTGHLPNFYTVGPALLWLPFVGPVHAAILAANHFGAHLEADGHSPPYVFALAGATALYGFLGLWLSFQLAKKYAGERWAFLATLGIWFASSLPVYMYLDPSWSHAHSAFVVALFLWYWDRTGASRTMRQWAILGVLAGLMMDVYLANGIFLLAPAADCVEAYAKSWRSAPLMWKDFRSHALFAAGTLLGYSPMLITRQIVYGNPFTLGMYVNVSWNWTSPQFRAVLFSAEHGLFVCTPILLLALLGLIPLARMHRQIGMRLIAMAVAFYCLISVYPWWDGRLSFGNRFFVSLTPVFIVGLAALFSWSARVWSDWRAAARRLAPVTALFILWNVGLVYQWSDHLFPHLGQVYWSEILYNQFRVVPQQILQEVSSKVPLDFRAHAQSRRD